jgi:hypothetical protein
VAGSIPSDSNTCPPDTECYPMGLITCIPAYTNNPTSILLSVGALKKFFYTSTPVTERMVKSGGEGRNLTKTQNYYEYFYCDFLVVCSLTKVYLIKNVMLHKRSILLGFN